MVLWPLSALEWLAGRWTQRARARHRGARARRSRRSTSHAQHWVGRAKALLEADLGLVDEARASADEVLRSPQTVAYEIFVIVTLGVLGRLELELGNLEAAGDHLRELPGRLLAGGMNDPTPSVWADADRDAHRPRRAGAGAFLPRAVRGQCRATREPVRERRGGPLPRRFSWPPRVSCPPRCRRSSARWPTPSRFRSSAAARCSVSASCAGRRSRRGRPARRSSRRSRSSRSWVHDSGRRGRGRSSGGSAAVLPRRTS